MPRSTRKDVLYAVLLLLASSLCCLAAVEISLRVFYPKYQHAAEAIYDSGKNRIWVRKKHTHHLLRHPDSGRSHLVYYNNLALRHHRDFAERDFEAATNIGFFGDSFTENVRLPVQYAFTEPLDYLLNAGTGKFNVLNLGVDGYGTDQAFLYYRDFVYAGDLDYVFYVFCRNDLSDIHQNDLYSLNAERRLVRRLVRASPWWIRAAGKFHTTYLATDFLYRLRGRVAGKRIDRLDIEYYYQRQQYEKRFDTRVAAAIQRDFAGGRQTADVEKSIAIFQALLRRWRQAVEGNGAKFYVVLLPRPAEHGARQLFAGDFDVIDLYARFDGDIDGYDYRHWRFANDGHWNEAANLLAAKHLYRILESDLKSAPISDDAIRKKLHAYYASFDGWMPDRAFAKEITVAPATRRSIRAKYSGLTGSR